MLPFWPTPTSNNLPVADPLLMTREGLNDSDMDLASATGEMSEPGFRHSRPSSTTSLVENNSPAHTVLPFDRCNLHTFHSELCPAYLVLLFLLFLPVAPASHAESSSSPPWGARHPPR